MDLIAWNNEMSVDIDVIDEQHQYLLKLINQLFEAVLEGEGNTIIEEIINKLIEYSSEHFATEEEYFDKYDYPEANLHKLEHVEFTKKVNSYKSQLINSEEKLPIEVFNFLKDWLREHILISDIKYSQYLRKKGVAEMSSK